MPTSSDRSGAAILIVDDQPSNLRLLELTLRRGGYVAFDATTNPSEVCALHGQNHYDLIVLDLQMPVIDGFQVLAALRAVDEHDRPAILVMSADPTQLLPALEAGATSFISKPFVLSEFLLQVRGLLKKTTSRQRTPAAAPAAA